MTATREMLISYADDCTAEGDKLEGRGDLLAAARAHRRAAGYWTQVGSIIMHNGCLCDAERCERLQAARM